MSALRSLSGGKRTYRGYGKTDANDPERKSALFLQGPDMLCCLGPESPIFEGRTGGAAAGVGCGRGGLYCLRRGPMPLVGQSEAAIVR